LTEVYLGLGSNQGPRLEILKNAWEQLKNTLVSPQASSVYKTDPMYDIDQAPFLNLVITGLYNKEPQDLLERIQEIEYMHGRIRNLNRPKGPRVLDIDILLFGTQIINTTKLTIPQRGIEERAFALVPLLELKRDLRSPKDLHLYQNDLEKIGEEGVYFFGPLE